MFTQEEAQYQIFQQPSFGAAPASPDGTLVPGESGWNVKRARNPLDNTQVQADGFEREFAHGNHNSTAGGTIIYNINVLGRWLQALCGSLTSGAFTGVLGVTVTNGGSGYTSAPAVSFTGGVGTGAAAVAVVLGGEVVAVVMTNHGTGYTGAPTVAFTGGGGTGAAATAAIDAAKYKHVGKLSPGAPLFHLIEKGVAGQALYRQYFNMVLRKVSFSDQVEGISSLSDEWIGSGKMVKSATSLDATPTEVTGTPGEYANLYLIEGGAVGGIITELSCDIEGSVKEKRPPSYNGQASELRKGGWTVRGSGRAYFEDETLVAKAEAGTLTSLQATVISPDGVFTRLMPESKLEVPDWERSDDGLVLPFNYRSIKKVSASAPIEFTLINAVSAYA